MNGELILRQQHKGTKSRRKMLLIMVEVTKIITKNSESQNLDMYIFTLMWHIYRFFVVVVVTFFSVIFIMNNCYAFIHAVGSCLTYK